MLEIKDTLSQNYINGLYNLRYIPDDMEDDSKNIIGEMISRYNRTISSYSRQSYMIYGTPEAVPYKKDIPLLPITTIFSGKNSLTTGLDSDEGVMLTLNLNTERAIASSFGLEEVEAFKDIIKENNKALYLRIIEGISKRINPYLVIPDTHHTYANTRVMDLINFIRSSWINGGICFVNNGDSNTTNITLSGIFPFYYSLGDRIVFSMMIKRESVVQFRNNWMNGKVDSNHVEIWIEKRFHRTKDRKQLHHYINTILIKELKDTGFNIVEKDNILDELLFRPKIKLPSFDQIDIIKKRISESLLEKIDIIDE